MRLLALALAPALSYAAPDTIFVDSFEQTIAYDIAFTPNTAIGPSTALISSLNVPAGSYVAFVRMEVSTGSTAPGNGFRFDCNLSPGFDNVIYRVGTETNVERYLTLQGAVTFSGATNIQFSCRDGNGGTNSLLSGKLTVMSASAVN